MTGDLVIGVDVGSQGTCAQLIEASGKLIGASYVAHHLSYPRPGWAEQDPREWVSALTEALGEVIREIPAERVAAIAFASQLDGLVPVDRACQPVRPAMIWMDRRADAECDIAAACIDPARLREISGCNLDASHVAAKIAWLCRHEPEAELATHSYLLPGRLRRVPRVRRPGDRPVERVLDDAARRAQAPLVGRGVRGVRHRPDAPAPDRGSAERARSGRRLAARGHRAHGEPRWSSSAAATRWPGRSARASSSRATSATSWARRSPSAPSRTCRCTTRRASSSCIRTPIPRAGCSRTPGWLSGGAYRWFRDHLGERRGGAGIAHRRGRVRAAERRRGRGASGRRRPRLAPGARGGDDARVERASTRHLVRPDARARPRRTCCARCSRATRSRCATCSARSARPAARSTRSCAWPAAREGRSRCRSAQT